MNNSILFLQDSFHDKYNIWNFTEIDKAVVMYILYEYSWSSSCLCYKNIHFHIPLTKVHMTASQYPS